MPEVVSDASPIQYLHRAGLLDLRFTGTLGVLLKAKETRLLPALGPVLDRLQALGFWVDPATRDAVRRLAGE